MLPYQNLVSTYYTLKKIKKPNTWCQTLVNDLELC